MGEDMSKRVAWIDIAKGIGIILVVLGHNVNTGSSLFNYIYFFHMPLFFFLSGYLFKSEKYPNVRKFVVDKFKKLLIPYLVFGIVSIMFFLIKNSSSNCIKELVLSMRTRLPFNEPIWFLTSLFLVELMYFILDTKIKNGSIKGLILLITSSIAYKSVNSPCLPWTLDTAAYYILFFYIGSLMNRHDIINKVLSVYNEKRINKKLLICNISIITALVLNVISYIKAPMIYSFIIPGFYIGNFIMSVIIAMSGIIMVIIVANVFCEERILIYLGKNTLFILCVHNPLRDFIIQPILVKNNVWINPDNYSLGIFYTILLIIISIFLSQLCNKYCPYIIGKDKS